MIFMQFIPQKLSHYPSRRQFQFFCLDWSARYKLVLYLYLYSWFVTSLQVTSSPLHLTADMKLAKIMYERFFILDWWFF